MRKQLLFLAGTFLLLLNGNAQIKKGSIFLGGNIGGSTQKTLRDRTTVNSQDNLNISPVFGKAIKENLILGADVGFGLYENNNSGVNSIYTDYRNKSYGPGIFIRKYTPIGKSDFFIFLQGRFGMNYFSSEYNPPANKDETKRYSFDISTYPGISYTISKRLQLETGFNNLLSIGYFTEKREVSGSSAYTDKTKGISINSSLNNLSELYIGFRVLINKS